MKRNPKNDPTALDTPATRKRRLQRRIKEISDKSEQEMATVMKSIEQIKASFKSTK